MTRTQSKVVKVTNRTGIVGWVTVVSSVYNNLELDAGP